MPATDEMQAEPSDAAEGGISREDVRWLFDSLMRVPLWWLVVVSIAVVLSCLTVTRAAGGSYIVTFAVTTTAVALLGVMWLPAVIRVLAIVFRKGRLFGFEISGAGMEGFLVRIARHKPAGVTFLATQPQIEPEADWPEADFEVPESEAEWEDEDRPKARAIPAWVEARDRIYEDNRDIFLVHQIQPSKRPEQLYDLFVFLAGAHGVQPADIVDQADFFLGRYWGTRSSRSAIPASARRSE